MKHDLHRAFELVEYLIDLERSPPIPEYAGPEKLGQELDLALRAEGLRLSLGAP